MKIFANIIILFLIASCGKPDEKNSSTQIKSDSLSPRILSTLEKFSLPFSEQLPDSNALFFYYSKRFDTSFLVHFERKHNETRGVLYEVLPSFHRDDKDFADVPSELLFFEGYSFKIDSIHWERIVKAAKNIFTKGREASKTEVCLDCPYYLLAFDSKVTDSYEKDRLIFKAYAQFLKDSLLNQYVEKRHPILHK